MASTSRRAGARVGEELAEPVSIQVLHAPRGTDAGDYLHEMLGVLLRPRHAASSDSDPLPPHPNRNRPRGWASLRRSVLDEVLGEPRHRHGHGLSAGGIHRAARDLREASRVVDGLLPAGHRADPLFGVCRRLCHEAPPWLAEPLCSTISTAFGASDRSTEKLSRCQVVRASVMNTSL